MIRRNHMLTVVAVMTLSTLVGCSKSSAQVQGSSTSAQITIKDFDFAPMSLTVAVGSTVTWENLDDEPHTVVSDTGLFRSGALDTKESFSFKFDKAGTYRFSCSIHPRMAGTIVVR